MKQTLLAFIIALPTFFFSSVQAWSPFDEIQSAVESMRHCNWIIAAGDDSQEGENKAKAEGEEEEPDCD